MSEFTFDLQRFSTTTDSTNAKFFVTNSEGTTYYDDDSDFTTDNLSGATEIKLLGNITLSSKVEISQTVEVDENATVTLDLNGYTVAPSNSNLTDTITVGTGDTLVEASTILTIKDTKGNGSIVAGSCSAIWVKGSGSCTLEGGTITANSGTTADCIYNKGTFTLNGGTITNNATSTGCGVNSREGGSFTMTSGTITAAYIAVNQSSGTFIMNNGTITAKGNSEAAMGVHVYDNGTFTMDSGDIISDHGGGVLCGSYGDTNPTAGTFTMNGGTITANGDTTNALGVFVVGDGSTFTMNEVSTIKAPKQLCVSVYGQGSGTYTDASKKNSFVMNGGTLEGDNGVAMYEGAANFNISGGTISATGEDSYAAYNSSSTDGTPGKLNITGGTFTGSVTNSGTLSVKNNVNIDLKYDDDSVATVTTTVLPPSRRQSTTPSRRLATRRWKPL